MPMFEYECPDCRQRSERFVRDRVNADMRLLCTVSGCYGETERIMSCPTIHTDSIPAYYDNGLGQVITSHTQRRDLMRAASAQECDPGNISPHGAKGTIFSFPGEATTSVKPSGAYESRRV